MTRSIALIALFLLSLTCQHLPAASPWLKDGDIPDMKVLRTEYYDDRSLWGYMDGAADLYLEYGFSKLIFQEIEASGKKFRFELFKMKSPESAFGIYSISGGMADTSAGIPFYHIFTPYQFLAAADSFYISLTSEDSSAVSRKCSEDISAVITATLKGRSNICLPAVFAAETLKKPVREVKFIKGVLGLQNSLPEWEEKFGGIENFSMYYLAVENDKESSETALISFAEISGLEKFRSQNSTPKKGRKRTLTNQGTGSLLFMDWKVK